MRDLTMSPGMTPCRGILRSVITVERELHNESPVP